MTLPHNIHNPFFRKVKINLVYIVFILIFESSNKYYMYTIYNNIEDKTIFTGNTNEFLRFVNKIRIENEDYDFSILGISDAKEYIENYCSNLTLID